MLVYDEGGIATALNVEIAETGKSLATSNWEAIFMVLGLLKKGDEVLNVTNDFVAIKRKKGNVDIIPIIKEGVSWRVNFENIVTIGYGENTVSFENENGVEITNF